MIRVAHPLDAGAVGRILSEFIDTTDWMPRLHSRAEDISFAGTMIDRGWVRVFEEDAILGFISRSDEGVCALYVARAARARGRHSPAQRCKTAETKLKTLDVSVKSSGAKILSASRVPRSFPHRWHTQ